MKRLVYLILFACFCVQYTMAATVTTITDRDKAIADGTVLTIRIGDQYLYGSTAQNCAMGDADAAIASTNAVIGFLLEKVDNGYMFRCVTPAGGDYALWGKDVCYLNSQPNIDGVTFNLGKDQDCENGSTWTFEADGSIKNVGSGGYFNGTNISATSVVCSLVTITGDIDEFAANNLGFETGDFTAWTNDGFQVQNNTAFQGKVGNYYAEKWTASTQTLANSTLTQKITDLENGKYKVSAIMQNINQGNDDAFANGFYLTANENQTEATTNYSRTEVITTVSDGTLTFGVKTENCTGNWVAVDAFKFELYDGTEPSDTIVPSDTIKNIVGNFYLKNVATGKYLGSGNTWDTQASLCDHGMELTFTKLSDGRYTIETNYRGWWNDTHSYLGGYEPEEEANDNGYTFMDCPYLMEFEVNNISDNVITIARSGHLLCADSEGLTSVVDYAELSDSSPYAQWQMVTKEDLVDALSDASVDTPVDATFFIGNPAFYTRYNNDKWEGLEESNYGEQQRENNNINICIKPEEGSNGFSQTLIGLPNGKYRLTMQGYVDAEQNDNVYLFANEVKQLINVGGTDAPTSQYEAGVSFRNGNYNNSLDVTVIDSNLRIGVRTETGNISATSYFDNFELYYLGTEQLDTFAIQAGEYVDITIDLKDHAPQGTGYQADFYLPEGISLATDSLGNYLITQPNGEGKHSIMSNKQTDGAIRVLIFSPNNTTFAESEGSVVSARCYADLNMALGEYKASVKNRVVSTQDATITLELPDTEYLIKVTEPIYYNLVYVVDDDTVKTESYPRETPITIMEEPTKEGYAFSGWSGFPEDSIMPAHDVTVTGEFYILGDVNGDGKINVGDIAGISNIVLGVPEELHYRAADVTRDSITNVEDIYSLANYIMYGSFAANNKVINIPEAVNELLTAKIAVDSQGGIYMTVCPTEDKIVSIQFDLVLPEGLEVKTDIGGEHITPIMENAANHSLLWRKQDNGAMRILNYSAVNKAFANSRAIAKIQLVGDDTLQGEYPIRFENVTIITSDATAFRGNATSQVVIDNATRIDAIEDGRTDVNCQAFDLSGRRINKAERGVNIINGKKIIK